MVLFILFVSFCFGLKTGQIFSHQVRFFYVCYDAFVSSNSAIAVYCATNLSQSWWWFHVKCDGPSNLKLIDCLQFEMHRFLITKNEKLIKKVNFERNFEWDSLKQKNAMEFHIEQNNNDEEYWGKKTRWKRVGKLRMETIQTYYMDRLTEITWLVTKCCNWQIVTVIIALSLHKLIPFRWASYSNKSVERV